MRNAESMLGPPGNTSPTSRTHGPETSETLATKRSLDRLGLLDLDSSARLGNLLLDVLGVVLRNTGLDLLRRAVDQVLGLLEAEVGDLADRLDDLDLVATGIRENDGELGLLGLGLAGAGRRRRANSARDRNRSRLHAPLVLELLGQLGNLHDREVRERIDNLVHVHVGHCPVSLVPTCPLPGALWPT